VDCLDNYIVLYIYDCMDFHTTWVQSYLLFRFISTWILVLSLSISKFSLFNKVNCKIELFFENRNISNYFLHVLPRSMWRSLSELYFSTLPFSWERLLHQSKSISKCLNFTHCQGHGQNISNLLVKGNILELHYFLLKPSHMKLYLISIFLDISWNIGYLESLIQFWLSH